MEARKIFGGLREIRNKGVTMLDLTFGSGYEVEYPTSDGKPMAETDTHRDQMINLILALEHHFKDDPQVYVSGNILMFYQKGDGHKHRSPDVLIALDVEKRQRDHYKIWEEGKAPDVVFEITSRSTKAEDLGDKKGLYAYLGVKEYVIFDPLEEYLEPRLRLYRLVGEEFLPVAGKPLTLETVQLELHVVDGELRLRDIASQEFLLAPMDRADEESARADHQATRAEEAEKRAEQEARRAEQEAKRAEQEAKRADEATERAEREASRAREAEAELERLRKELDSR
jgi:Uma2 family endonuclease